MYRFKESFQRIFVPRDVFPFFKRVQRGIISLANTSCCDLIQARGSGAYASRLYESNCLRSHRWLANNSSCVRACGHNLAQWCSYTYIFNRLNWCIPLLITARGTNNLGVKRLIYICYAFKRNFSVHQIHEISNFYSFENTRFSSLSIDSLVNSDLVSEGIECSRERNN